MTQQLVYLLRNIDSSSSIRHSLHVLPPIAIARYPGTQIPRYLCNINQDHHHSSCSSCRAVFDQVSFRDRGKSLNRKQRTKTDRYS